MSDDPAQARFAVISITRLLGVVSLMLGLAIQFDRLDWPNLIGWIFLLAGLYGFFLAPTMLAKKWRSPDQPTANLSDNAPVDAPDQ